MNTRERARLAANERWSRAGAREEASRTLRAANRRRYERLVDPDGLMLPYERDAAVANARRAEMARVRAARATPEPTAATPLRRATR